MAASSLALTLGTTAVRQLDGLFSLNDLHAAAGGEKRHQPSDFLRNDQAQALIAEIHSADSRSAQSPEMASAVSVINGGPERGTYACRELVIAYAAWISPEFHLKVIRVFLAVASPAAPPPPLIATTLSRVIEERDYLRKLLQEQVLLRHPELRQVLRYHRIQGLTYVEKARLMGWASNTAWMDALKKLAAVGLIDYTPDPRRVASGKASMSKLRARLAGAAPGPKPPLTEKRAAHMKMMVAAATEARRRRAAAKTGAAQ
jgi:hypothetical protein